MECLCTLRKNHLISNVQILQPALIFLPPHSGYCTAAFPSLVPFSWFGLQSPSAPVSMARKQWFQPQLESASLELGEAVVQAASNSLKIGSQTCTIIFEGQKKSCCEVTAAGKTTCKKDPLQIMNSNLL